MPRNQKNPRPKDPTPGKPGLESPDESRTHQDQLEVRPQSCPPQVRLSKELLYTVKDLDRGPDGLAMAGTQSAPGLFSRGIRRAFWQLAETALKPITGDRTANAQTPSRRSPKRRLEMPTTVSRLFRPPMAMFALWATIHIFATFAAPAQKLLGATHQHACHRQVVPAAPPHATGKV